MITAHQVQAQVDAGGDSGAGHHLPGVDVADVRVDPDARVTGGELAGVAPGRRGPPAVEQPGGGERERTGAHRYEIERDDVRQGQRDDKVHGSADGSILTVPGVPATGGAAVAAAG